MKRPFFRSSHKKSRKNEITILVIDHQVPLFHKDAGSLRMCKILKILHELNYRVTVLGDQKKDEPYYSMCEGEKGVRVIHFSNFFALKVYLFFRKYDIIILSRLHIAEKYLPLIKGKYPNEKIIFDTVDLRFLRLERMARIENNAELSEQAQIIKDTTIRVLGSVHSTWVTSPFEKKLLKAINPNFHLEIVPIIYESQKKGTKISDHRKDLLFVGSLLHAPNIDAIHWFVGKIFPIILKRIPDIKLFIVGENPPDSIQNIQSESVIVTGYIKDLSPYFNQCRVFIAPLRYGAGVKGKIAESMSYGLPVVTTSIGAEGMHLVDGENALIADIPETFAFQCIDLYFNDMLWEKISETSKTTFDDNFSYSACKDKIKKIMENILRED